MGAQELIADALDRADSSPADVRKAALLRIARVQTVVYPNSARTTLEAGLAASHGLLESSFWAFDDLSRSAVAAVAPELLKTMSATPARWGLPDDSDRLARMMIEHGHADYLRTYILRDAPLADVPLHGIQALMLRTDDLNERQILLRRAVESWRDDAGRSHRGRLIHNHYFYALVRANWKILLYEEAVSTIKEIIDHTLQEPDTEVNWQVHDVLFTSVHAVDIFQNFDLILELDPERAKTLPQTHPELARALERYPEGYRSIELEAEAEHAGMPPRDPNQRGMLFSGADFRYGMAMRRAEESHDFAGPLKHAHARYLEDSDPKNPNTSSKAFWPSTAMFINIWYNIGLTSDGAAQEISLVPDSELRLFAQIELAAGLSRLPELSMQQTLSSALPIPPR